MRIRDWSECICVRTEWRQLVLHLQHHTLTDVLQHADDLIMSEFGQVYPVHWFDVVPDIELVTPATDAYGKLNNAVIHFGNMQSRFLSFWLICLNNKCTERCLLWLRFCFLKHIFPLYNITFSVTVKQGNRNAKVMGSIPRECKS